MTSAATVLVCALSLLGRSADKFPPITFVDRVPDEISPRAEGFISRDPETIVLVTSSAAFQDAARARTRCGNTTALKKVASVVVHEEWHLRHGADEEAAYHAQLTALRALGVQTDSAMYHGVMKAMLSVARGQKRARQAELLAAARR